MNPFTHVVNWPWYYVALYFYISGVSAGAYFIGSLAELYGGERQREIGRVAFSLALPLILTAPVLLIADLGRPERFWHLLFYSKDGIPYINLQSPMSVGAWGLTAYGGFALLSFLNTMAINGRLTFAPFAKLYNRLPRKAYAVIGMLTGLFVAGYPGVLLNVTAWPLWEATSPLLGSLFIASGASTGAAAIVLVMARQKSAAGETYAHLEKLDRVSMIIELLIIGAVIVVAGQYAAPIMSGFYGVMFWGGTVFLGILFPLGLYWYAGRPGVDRDRVVMLTAVLVLFGGALLRISLMQAG
jgi:formate-dependent nitrite reductase membrane component NrfD